MTIDILQAGRQQGKTLGFYVAEQAAGRLPIVALSIKQPWAWLIVNGWKDVENRDWRRAFPPRTLVHAGKKIDEEAEHSLLTGVHPVSLDRLPGGLEEAYVKAKKAGEVHQGGLVGVTGIVACHDIMTTDFESEWFVGTYGYQVSNAAPLPFLSWRGMLGFFGAKVQL